ncbi:hypothetical protein SLA2020_155080 [Shorea laevis]
MNQALLAKLGWKLLTEEKSFWVELIKKKYYSDESFLQVELKNGLSSTWRGILKARPLVQEGIGYLARSSKEIKFWLDHWVSDSSLALKATNPIELVNLDQDVDNNDIIYWKETQNGDFTTTSAYNLLLKSIASPIAGCWSKIWKVKAPPKTKTFLWLVLHNKVLTNASRMEKGMTIDDKCPRCQNGGEDVLHLVRDCASSHQIWSRWLSEEQQERRRQLSLLEWVRYNHQRSNVKVDFNLSWDATFAIIVWFLWLGRNQAVFKGD